MWHEIHCSEVLLLVCGRLRPVFLPRPASAEWSACLPDVRRSEWAWCWVMSPTNLAQITSNSWARKQKIYRRDLSLTTLSNLCNGLWKFSLTGKSKRRCSIEACPEDLLERANPDSKSSKVASCLCLLQKRETLRQKSWIRFWKGSQYFLSILDSTYLYLLLCWLHFSTCDWWCLHKLCPGDVVNITLVKGHINSLALVSYVTQEISVHCCHGNRRYMHISCALYDIYNIILLNICTNRTS